ncbi:MAG: hypothetical protein WAP23_02280 [Candidatus Spechtbacterales bacterium]
MLFGRAAPSAVLHYFIDHPAIIKMSFKGGGMVDKKKCGRESNLTIE